MLDYLKRSNPYFDSVLLEKQVLHSPFYTDTDSIQIHQKDLRGISLNNEIGGISDDLGDDCKILSGGWIAPKLYFLEYAEKKDNEVSIKYHFRGKGIPKNKLTLDMFEKMMGGDSIKVEMTRDFQKVHINKNSNQKDVENFSILKLESIYKEINSTPWSGRHFDGNSSVPHGHSSI